MDYSKVAECYSKLESISGRNEITEVYASLLKETPTDEIPMLVYLTQGKLKPDYEGVELGLAEKMALRILATASGVSQGEVYKVYVKHGDIGSAAEQVLSKKSQSTLYSEGLSLKRVYGTLLKVAGMGGVGSVDAKVRELVSLLNDASPVESKFIMRTVTGALRLGLADYTVLDASAIAFLGDKKARLEIERAYNLHPDLGYVVQAVSKKKLKGIRDVKVEVGVPIRPMLAERLESAAAIIKKMKGKSVAAEYKLDGERVQVHKDRHGVRLFSRRLEVITQHYPDVVELSKKHVKAKTAILEAEVVALSEDTGEYLPFQELMHRRRKYGVEEAIASYPVALNFFEVLLNGSEETTEKDYVSRRKTLESIVEETERTRSVPVIRTSDPDRIEQFMEEAIQNGCEGLVVKDPDSTYRAGAREFAWIKLKREYRSDLTDTLDLAVIGGFHGRGRRAGHFGTFLVAAYDEKRSVFTALAKIGTGFSDEDLARIPKLLEPFESAVRPPNVESKLEPDVWFRPHVVLETIASELTLSPIHTAAMGRIRPGAGISLRFPKFTGKVRGDKRAEDSTTVEEIVEMYNSQLKKITAGQ